MLLRRSKGTYSILSHPFLVLRYTLFIKTQRLLLSGGPLPMYIFTTYLQVLDPQRPERHFLFIKITSIPVTKPSSYRPLQGVITLYKVYKLLLNDFLEISSKSYLKKQICFPYFLNFFHQLFLSWGQSSIICWTGSNHFTKQAKTLRRIAKFYDPSVAF